MLIKDITVIYHSLLGISHHVLPFHRRTSSFLLCLKIDFLFGILSIF